MSPNHSSSRNRFVPARLLAVGVAALCCLSAVWTVDDDGPADFSSIQAAINAAANGDEIIVKRGRYRETLNFLGKAITVRSEEGPRNTIVFLEGETRIVLMNGDSTLKGFTIRGGQARIGAGIQITDGARPVIEANIIENNTAVSDGPTRPSFGGAIAVMAASEPVITRNLIRNNEAMGDAGGMYAYGGAIDIGDYTTATITNNVFVNNRAAETGGAISIGLAGQTSPVVITNNTLVTSRAVSLTSGVPGFGGGVFVYDGAAAVIQNNIFKDGEAATAGGGVYIDAPNANGLTYETNDFHNNAPDDCAGISASQCQNGQFFLDPLVQDLAGGNLRLRSDSPLLDLGTTGHEGATDLDDLPRVQDSDLDGTAGVDLGAYENQAEMTRLRFTDATTLVWDGSSNAAVTFDLYRDDLAALGTGPVGVCLQADLPSPSAVDTDLPGVGAGFLYLVSGSDATVGSLGRDSNGVERTAFTPCP